MAIMFAIVLSQTSITDESSALRKVILTDGKTNGYYKGKSRNDDEEKFQLTSSMLVYIKAKNNAYWRNLR